MNSRTILGAVVVLSAVAGTACGSDSTGTPVVQSTTYTSTLNAANERPATTSTATGSATYVLTGNTLTFAVSVNGLTGTATNSHIHVGSAAVAGPVIVGFVTAGVASGNVTSGTIDLTQPITTGASTISGDSLKALLNNGNAYTNVHTLANPGGEIRGQIIKQ